MSAKKPFTVLIICSNCGYPMHASCGVMSGDSNSICFSCHNGVIGMDVIDNVNNVICWQSAVARNLLIVFFQPASFPAMNETRLLPSKADPDKQQLTFLDDCKAQHDPPQLTSMDDCKAEHDHS